MFINKKKIKKMLSKRSTTCLPIAKGEAFRLTVVVNDPKMVKQLRDLFNEISKSRKED